MGDDVLPPNWQDQRFVGFLPLLASAVEFETCARLPIYVGDRASSFDRIMAAQRLSNNNAFAVGYNGQPICTYNCTCSWYCCDNDDMPLETPELDRAMHGEGILFNFFREGRITYPRAPQTAESWKHVSGAFGTFRTSLKPCAAQMSANHMLFKFL